MNNESQNPKAPETDLAERVRHLETMITGLERSISLMHTPDNAVRGDVNALRNEVAELRTRLNAREDNLVSAVMARVEAGFRARIEALQETLLQAVGSVLVDESKAAQRRLDERIADVERSIRGHDDLIGGAVTAAELTIREFANQFQPSFRR